MAAFEQRRGTVRTKRLWLFVIGMTFTVAGMLPAIFAALHAVSGGPLAYWLVVATYYASTFALLGAWSRWWRAERGRLRADENGLSVGNRLVVRRSAIRHGYVLQRDGQWLVRLGHMLRMIDVPVADAAEGEALLAAMRLDAARSVAQFPMTSGTWRGSLVRAGLVLVFAAVLGIAVPLVLMISAHMLATGFVVMVVAALALQAFVFNQMLRVSVGADGLRVRHLFGRSRFVPFSAIDKAALNGRDITIRLTDGTTIAMHHPSGENQKSLLARYVDRGLEGRKLVERINERVAAHRAKDSPDAPVFARAGRETEAWLREVVTAADVNASYRTPAVPPEELWRIVEDVAALPTERAGAAVALRSALDEPGRARLEAVADACAAPRLRVALETVATAATTDEDPALLIGALDALVDDDEPRRASRRSGAQ